jgi:hypothetical protein
LVLDVFELTQSLCANMGDHFQSQSIQIYIFRDHSQTNISESVSFSLQELGTSFGCPRLNIRKQLPRKNRKTFKDFMEKLWLQGTTAIRHGFL